MVEMTGAIIVAEEATIEIADVLENTKLITNDKNKGKNEDTKNSKVTEDSVDISDAVEEAEEKAKSIEEVKVEAVEANIVSTKEEEITVAKEAISFNVKFAVMQKHIFTWDKEGEGREQK